MKNGKTFELDEVIQHFVISWNNDFTNSIKIIKPDLNLEHYFNKGIKFLINYFMKHKPFKDNTIATEKKVFVNLDNKGEYKLIGYIDRLVHNRDLNILEVHDYKTSSSIKSQQELDNDRQLALYSIAIREEFKDAEDVHLIWHFLDFNQTLTSKRTSEQLEYLKQELIDLIIKIESTTDFPPNLGCLCNWCEFQSKCQEFQKNINQIQLTSKTCQSSLEDFNNHNNNNKIEENGN